MNPDGAEPAAPQAKILSLTQILDVAWKAGLFCSLALYLIGLVISNLHAGRFGRYSLGLNEPDSIIVGLLWAILAVVGYFVYRQIRELWQPTSVDNSGKRRGVAFRLFWTALLTSLFYLCSGTAVLVLEVGEVFSKPALTLFAIVIGTGAALDINVREVRRLFAIHALLPPSGKEFHALLVILRYVVWLPVVIVLYASVAFPMLPPAFGGGRMPEANVFVKPESEGALKIAGLSINGNHSLGQWSVVAELPDALVLTDSKLFSTATARTIWLKKENVAALVYLNHTQSALSPTPPPP
jgi:hypothetical protein